MKAVLYCRVSSKEQEETGYSLPAQEKLLKEYSERKDLKVIKNFSISESASGHHQREIFNKMLDYVKTNGISVIVCEKVDRLTRNLKDAVSINEWLEENRERQVHFVKQNLVISKESKSDEKFRWDIEIVLSKKFITNLSEEVRKGQKEKISQGWLPTKPPLGYKTIGDKGHKIHIKDEEKSRLVKRMFELYSTGEYSLKKLREIIFSDGLRTRGGIKIPKSRMASLLSDPFYCGKMKWKGEIFKGKHEPLISEELFNSVQEVLHSKRTPRYRKHLFLFKGLVFCKECGGMITWEKHKGIIYGHCNYEYHTSCSQRKWYKENDLNKEIIKALKKLCIKNKSIREIIRIAMKQGYQNEIEFSENALKELQKRHEQIQNRISRLYDDRIDEKISEDFYKNKFAEYSKEKEEVVSSIQKHSRASDKLTSFAVEAYDLSQESAQIYTKTTLEDAKREFLRVIFKTLYIDENGLFFDLKEPFNILFEAVKETNCSKLTKIAGSEIRIFELKKLLENPNQNSPLRAELTSLLRR